MMSSAPYLLMRDLTCRINDNTILECINLNSTADDCTALVGPNGAGKSTFLKICHGLLLPNSGEIRWRGHTPAQMGRKIAMVFHKPCLLNRSVRANLSYVLSLRRIRRKEQERHIDEALGLVGLQGFGDRNAVSLSGGEQQRLAIARAWLLQPEIILMDEPCTGLDSTSSNAVEGLILKLKQQAIKIIFSSHNLAQVRRLCDEIVFLDRSRCIRQCSVDDFFDNPQKSEICEFMRLQVLASV